MNFGINADGTQMTQEEADAYAQLHPAPHFTTEIKGEWLNTVGFNVFSWTSPESAVTERPAMDHAIPYEGIAYVRRAELAPESVEVYMREGYYKTYHAIVGDDAFRFWEWYTK